MLDESETLEAVFSFLAQFDLPTELTGLDNAKDHEVPGELLPSTSLNAETTELESLFALDTKENDERSTSPASSEDSTQQLREGYKTKKRPTKARISRKHQIDALREEIQDLNAELQTLAQHRQCSGLQISRSESLWEEIAHRQLERRQQSEEMNVKLREMVEIQVHEAKNLRRVLKRRARIEMMENMLGVKRLKAASCGVPEDNPQVFESMLQDMDELYVGTDRLFEEKGLYDLPCPGRRSDVRRNVNDGLFLDLLHRHLIPFGLQTSEKAIWKAMHKISFQGLHSMKMLQKNVQFHSHHIDESKDTIRMSFVVDTSNMFELKGAQFRKVVKKYVEENRVVVICKGLMEPILHDNSTKSGFHTRTTLRIVLRQGHHQAAEYEGVTLIESHFIATRYDQGLPCASVVRTSSNMDLGVAAWDEAISQIAHQVENLAIDEECENIRP